jgi:pantoate--beta-alanine ligase
VILARTRDQLASALESGAGEGGRRALIPTMGALHEGHLSLFDLALARASQVVVSIFVNPLQFDRGSDLAAYPRTLERDLEVAESRGVDVVFAPEPEEVYPQEEPQVTVDPGPLGDVLEGAFRPGHFRGVLTVVAKLFHLVRPQVAVFGAKDFQQVALVRRMVDDLNFPVEILVGETIREADGVALSSRNLRLDPDQRLAATALSRALRVGAAAGEAERDAAAVLSRMRDLLAEEPGVEVEYVQIVDPRTLEAVPRIVPGSVAVVAAQVGPVRLIDNLVLGGR